MAPATLLRCLVAVLWVLALLAGARADEPIAITGPVRAVSPEGTDSFTPSVAPTGDGGFLVAWTALPEDADPEALIAARRVDPKGAPVGEAFQLDEGVAYSALPALEPTAGGGFVVAWSQLLDAYEARPRARRLDTNGVPVGAEIAVGEPVRTTSAGVDVASAGDGGFVVLWTGSHPPDEPSVKIQGRRFDSAGGALGAELDVSSPDPGGYDLAVAPTSLGDFAALWSEGDVFARRLAPSGAPSGDAIVLTEATVDRTDSPAIAVDDDGRALAAWRRASQDARGVTRSRTWVAPLAPSGSAFAVDDVEAQLARLAPLGDGEFLVVWLDPSGDPRQIGARRVDADGPLGASFLVDTAIAGGRGALDVATSSSGTLVAWQRDGEIESRFLRSPVPLFEDDFESGDLAAWALLP